MRGLQKCWLAVAVLLGALSGAAQAIPVITFTERATVSASLDGGNVISDLLLVITGVGNPADSQLSGFLYTNSNASTTFVLTDSSSTVIGSGSFSGSTYWYSNTLAIINNVFTGTGGFVATGSNGATNESGTVLGTIDDAFSIDNYDLTSDYGPITNSPFFRPDLTFTFNSTHTLLISAARSATFQAVLSDVTTVPEPQTLVLMSLALAGIFATRRSKSV